MENSEWVCGIWAGEEQRRRRRVLGRFWNHRREERVGFVWAEEGIGKEKKKKRRIWVWD